MNKYSSDFYDSVSSRAAETARILSNIFSQVIRPNSIVDIGSGLGIWSKVFLETFPEIDQLTAIDLERHESEILDSLEDASCFTFSVHDLESKGGLPGTYYDLAICVEVLEHVSPAAAEVIFDEFAAKCSFIIFGAAIKGQGGTHHINESSFAFWTKEMFNRGLIPLDVARPKLKPNNRVPGYYKYNIIVWWNPSLQHNLPTTPNFELLFRAFPPSIEDTRPILTRVRYSVLSILPHQSVTRLAKVAALLRNFRMTK